MHVKQKNERREQEIQGSLSPSPTKNNRSHFFSFFLSLFPFFSFKVLDITSSTALIVKSESPPKHAKLLLLSGLRAIAVLFSIHSIAFVGKPNMSTGDDCSLGVALAASDVGSHLAREKDGLLVSTYAVTRAGA